MAKMEGRIQVGLEMDDEWRELKEVLEWYRELLGRDKRVEDADGAEDTVEDRWTPSEDAGERARMDYRAAKKVLAVLGEDDGFMDERGRRWVLKYCVDPVEMLTKDQRRAIMHEELGKQGRGAVVIDDERRSWSVYLSASDPAQNEWRLGTADKVARGTLGGLGVGDTFKDSRGRNWAVYVSSPPETKTDLEIAKKIVAEHLTCPGWFADAYGQRWIPQKNATTDMHIAADVLSQFGPGAEFWDAKKRSWRQGAGRFGHSEVLEMLAGNTPEVEYIDRRGRTWKCTEETGKSSVASTHLGKGPCDSGG